MHSYRPSPIGWKSKLEGAGSRLFRWLTSIFLLGMVSLFGQSAAPARAPQSLASLPQPAAAAQENILDYIHKAWETLRRSMNECSSIVDPKLAVDAHAMLYLPIAVIVPSEIERLDKECQ